MGKKRLAMKDKILSRKEEKKINNLRNSLWGSTNCHLDDRSKRKGRKGGARPSPPLRRTVKGRGEGSISKCKRNELLFLPSGVEAAARRREGGGMALIFNVSGGESQKQIWRREEKEGVSQSLSARLY